MCQPVNVVVHVPLEVPSKDAGTLLSESLGQLDTIAERFKSVESRRSFFVALLAGGGGHRARVAVSLDRAHPPVVRERKSDVVPHCVCHKVHCILFVT